jgi:hypothetical protein
MNWTSRATPGGHGGSRPALLAQDTRAKQTYSGTSPDSRVQEPEPFIQPFEFGSYCLLFGVLFVPSLFVCAACFFYALLIA